MYRCDGCTSATGCDDCPAERCARSSCRVERREHDDHPVACECFIDEEQARQIQEWKREAYERRQLEEYWQRPYATPSYVIVRERSEPRWEIQLPGPSQLIRYWAYDIRQCLRPQLRVPLDGFAAINRAMMSRVDDGNALNAIIAGIVMLYGSAMIIMVFLMVVL